MNTGERVVKDFDWGIPVQVVLCEACDWKYLLPSGQQENKCPHCFSADLVFVSDDQENIHPELYLPYEVSDPGLAQSIQHFASGLWLPPVDLTVGNLSQRLRRVFLPVWLIDSQVTAQWQAEAGFNYQVVSHQDSYDDSGGGWSSREVTETRVRWEPRVGRLNKIYQNIAVPALEKHSVLMRQLGEYSYDQALAYNPKMLDTGSNQRAFIRLADRSQKDAWPDALPHFQILAAENCREASSADHLRNFAWKPEFQDLHWTLMMLPLLTTYYLDDQNHPQPLLIHGQTGRLYGIRRASMQRARNAALWMAGIALIIFIISLIGALSSALLPGLLILAMIGWGLAILFGVGALVPLVMVWWINRLPNSFSG